MTKNEKLYQLAIGVKDFATFENLLGIIDDDNPVIEADTILDSELIDYIQEERRVLKGKKHLNCHESGQLYTIELIISEITKT